MVNDFPPDRIEDVTVVGGGDSGLMAALILKKVNPDLRVTLIDDFAEAIPEVGKSTISYILHFFHEALGIDRNRFASEVKPVWKASVYFKDWCGRGPFHVPFDGFTLQPAAPSSQRFEILYSRHEQNNFHTLGEEIVEQRVSPFVREGGNITLYNHVAYHLGTDRLNDFLRDICNERGIDLVDDRITDVRTADGRIARLVSEEREYESDLYIDASGFTRLLMGTLDNEFTTFDFPLDSAVVAKAELSLSDIVPATVITSGDCGWFWQIDTYDWRDLGYVYASEYLSDEDAISEFMRTREEDISRSDIRRYRFESGALERAWVSNCIAVGNALGFVEPLQSTALTVNAQLTEKLAELLADHNRINHEGLRNIYNRFSQCIWENVYDFVSLHYRFAAGENEFWEKMRTVNRDGGLARYIDTYHGNGFSSFEEFDGRDGPTLTVFNQYLFYQLLRELGVRSEFYETIDVDVGPDVQRDILQFEKGIRDRASDHLTYEEIYTMESVFR